MAVLGTPLWRGLTYLFVIIIIGQLYGLEKFWAFLKYSKAKNLDIDSKLQEYLSKFRRLEDFRVDVSGHCLLPPCYTGDVVWGVCNERFFFCSLSWVIHLSGTFLLLTGSVYVWVESTKTLYLRWQVMIKFYLEQIWNGLVVLKILITYFHLQMW